MKPFYCLVLLVGFCMAILMQVVTIAIPKDAFVASVLSKSPGGWELTLDDRLKSRLARHDVKAELVVAMKNRASFQNEINSWNLWAGSGLIILAVIGLIRERKFDRRRKKSECAALPNGGLATPLMNSPGQANPPSGS